MLLPEWLVEGQGAVASRCHPPTPSRWVGLEIRSRLGSFGWVQGCVAPLALALEQGTEVEDHTKVAAISKVQATRTNTSSNGGKRTRPAQVGWGWGGGGGAGTNLLCFLSAWRRRLAAVVHDKSNATAVVSAERMGVGTQAESGSMANKCQPATPNTLRSHQNPRLRQ